MDNEFDDDDDEGGVVEYESQEFIFYLGDRKLGSFFMPVTGAASPEPITKRLITAPTKTQIGCDPALLWLEDTEDGAETMIWTADTPEEVAESERLFNAAHGLDASDDAATDFTPTPRSDEEKRLMQAILDDQGSNTPLLAYADWLTAQGNPQGEFIRVALEADTVTRDDPQFDAINARWAELLEQHGEAWYAPLSALNLFPYDRSFWILRGVIDDVEINRPSLLTARAEELFDAVPLLQKLSFDCEGFDVSTLADIPQLSQITSLGLSYLGVTPFQLSSLLASPHLRNLTDLDLGGNEPGTELVRAVVESPIWPRLRTLELASCEVDDEGLELIAGGSQPLALRTLNLEGSQCTERGLKALARSGNFKQLTSLNLGGIALTAEGVAALAQASWVSQLETLSLKQCSIDQSIAEELAKWPVRNLRQLVLGSCDLEDEAVITLAKSSLLSNVDELELPYNKLTDAGIAALAQSPAISKLTSLEVSSNPFGTKGVVALANSPHLSTLGTLKLDAIDFDSAGVAALVASPYLSKIHWLWIGDENQLTDADREQLVTRFGESVVRF